LRGHARGLGGPASGQRNSRRQTGDETVKKGDNVWFTDWRGARHAGVITNCDSKNGKPVFDISVHNEPITSLQTRRGYTWQIKSRD
jgi:hypothetical protein